MGYQLSQLTEETFPRLLKEVNERSDWEDKRKRIEQVWLEYLGWIPEPVEPAYTVISEHQEENHTRISLTYQTGFGDQVPAYLLVPHSDSDADAGAKDKRYPAVLALHPTDENGKADIATSSGRANRQYALELVSKGFVVLAPDTISAGDRIYEGAKAFQTAPFYEQYPASTAVGKMLHDHQQGIELLQTLSYVDSDRIGAIGHSLGAYNAYFLAAADDRIKAVVSSCGFSPFFQDPDPNRWGQRDWFSHIPRLTADIQADTIPFEFHEIMALMAPKPLFNWFTQNDAIFTNWKAASIASLDIDRLYRWLEHPERYVSIMGNEGHDFPEHIRAISYHFLHYWLK